MATNIFNKKMKIAFNEVRNEVANLNTFIQERLTGMKIVQLFNREKIELEKFKEINRKHNKAWLKNILYNSIFFPIADIISSITLGVIVLYGGFQILNGNPFTTIGQMTAYTMFIGMLFNPLRQIADKFNEMQMGMIASACENAFFVSYDPRMPDSHKKHVVNITLDDVKDLIDEKLYYAGHMLRNVIELQ
jgi:ABC-type multidrug transport system fused ATPase/permease subunit